MNGRLGESFFFSPHLPMTLFQDVGGIWRFMEENVTEEKRSRREEHAAMDSGNEPTNQLKSSSRDTI